MGSHTSCPIAKPLWMHPCQQLFLSLQGQKTLTSLPRHTKSPGNCSMLHMFNNNTYTDFRIANKRILIPSYVIRVI